MQPSLRQLRRIYCGTRALLMGEEVRDCPSARRTQRSASGALYRRGRRAYRLRRALALARELRAHMCSLSWAQLPRSASGRQGLHPPSALATVARVCRRHGISEVLPEHLLGERQQRGRRWPGFRQKEAREAESGHVGRRKGGAAACTPDMMGAPVALPEGQGSGIGVGLSLVMDLPY